MNIRISNLATELNNEQLRNLFVPHGAVQSAEIAMDLFTERPRGFGYVEMPDEEQAKAAITALNKTEVLGQVVAVQEVKPKTVHKGSYKVGDGVVKAYQFKK